MILLLVAVAVLLCVGLAMIVWCVWLLKRRMRATHVRFLVHPPEPTEGGVKMAEYATQTQITTIERQRFQVKPQNAQGHDVAIDGLPVITVFDESICTVVMDANGLGGYIIAGAPGVTTITATVDADLGNGVVQVSGQLEVTVTPDRAVQVRFLVDPAEPKPTT